jgi:hypothetical protein
LVSNGDFWPCPAIAAAPHISDERPWVETALPARYAAASATRPCRVTPNLFLFFSFSLFLFFSFSLLFLPLL